MKSQRYGAGERVFVGYHGWGSHQRKSFQELIPFIPDDVTLIGVDLPGCGDSDPLDRWGWDALGERVLQHLISELPDQKVTLVGSCSGTFHVLDIALRAPERVEAIVLLEPFAYMPWYFSIFLAPLTGKPLYHMVFNNPLGKAATRLSMRRKKIEGEGGVDMVDSFGLGTSLEVAYRYLQFYGELQDTSIYQPVSAPVRLVRGETTFEAIARSVAMWQQLWPDASEVVIEGAGHMLNQDAPARTAAAMFEPF